MALTVSKKESRRSLIKKRRGGKKIDLLGGTGPFYTAGFSSEFLLVNGQTVKGGCSALQPWNSLIENERSNRCLGNLVCLQRLSALVNDRASKRGSRCVNGVRNKRKEHIKRKESANADWSQH